MASPGKDRGLHLQAAGRLLLLLAVPILVSLFMWFVAFQAEQRSTAVERTLHVQIAIERLLLDNRIAGSSQRGFLLTRDGHFLDSYHGALKALQEDVQEVSRLVADNPRQIQSLAILKPLLDRRVQQLDAGLELLLEGANATDLGKNITEQQSLLDSIQSITAGMFQEEQQLLRTREAAHQNASALFRWGLFLGYGLIVAIVWSLYVSARRHSLETAEAQVRLSKLNADLDQRVRQRAAEVQAREELLEIFVRHVPAGVAMLDREMRYVQVSDRWCADYGFTREQFIGVSHYDLFPDLPAEWLEIHRRCLAGESMRRDEDRWYREDGTVKWLRWEIVPWGSKNGTPQGLLVFGEDITDRKQIEEMLRESEATNRTLLDTASQAILAVDRNGVIVMANAKTNEMFGYSGDELVGQEHEILMPEKVREGHRAHRSRFNANPIPRAMGTGLDLVGLRKDGTEFPIEVSLSSVETKRGLLAVSFVSDITERKRAESDLKHSEQQLRALAGSLLTAQEEERKQLARELHDDVTQQLAFLSIELGRLASRLPNASEVHEHAMTLQKQTIRASREVRRLSHGLHPSVIMDFGLAIALEEFCDEFGSAHNVNVEFEGLIEDGALNDAGATCLYRIAQESVRNALVHGQAKHIRVVLSSHAGLLQLKVTDDGVGISPDALRGKSGLGVVSMKERVRLVGGKLNLTSGPGGAGVVVTASVPFTGDSKE